MVSKGLKLHLPIFFIDALKLIIKDFLKLQVFFFVWLVILFFVFCFTDATTLLNVNYIKPISFKMKSSFYLYFPLESSSPKSSFIIIISITFHIITIIIITITISSSIIDTQRHVNWDDSLANLPSVTFTKCFTPHSQLAKFLHSREANNTLGMMV